MSIAAASPLSGSVGLGYSSSCGRNTSNTFTRSNMGLHVWLMTSKHTEPALRSTQDPACSVSSSATVEPELGRACHSKGRTTDGARGTCACTCCYQPAMDLPFINVWVPDLVHEADGG